MASVRLGRRADAIDPKIGFVFPTLILD